MRKTILDEIRDEDPEWDPVPAALESAGIDAETFKAAKDRIYCDGYHGPISAEDWREQDGREPATMGEALRIFKSVSDEIGDYTRREFGYCQGPGDIHEDDLESCEGHEGDPELSVSARDIRAARWPWYVEIYGTTP